MEPNKPETVGLKDDFNEIGSIQDKIRTQMGKVVEDLRNDKNKPNNRFLPIPRWSGSDLDAKHIRFDVTDDPKLKREIRAIRDNDGGYRVIAKAYFPANSNNRHAEFEGVEFEVPEVLDDSSSSSDIKNALAKVYDMAINWTVDDVLNHQLQNKPR